MLFKHDLSRHCLISNLVSKLQILATMLVLKAEILLRYLLISVRVLQKLPTILAHSGQAGLDLLQVDLLVLIRGLWITFSKLEAIILVNSIFPLILRDILAKLPIDLILLHLQLFLK